MHLHETACPMVSIIIPTYNNEARIARTLENIISQDYPNIEIIVVNDVSQDTTAAIARRVLTSWGGPFQVIDRSVNGGQSSSRNTGLDAASGKYVIFFDHDDLAEKNYVSRLCGEIERVKADVTFCGYKVYYEAESRYEEVPMQLTAALASPEDYVIKWLKGKLGNTIWCYIFRKEFLLEHKLRFTEACHVGEDIEFFVKALTVSARTSFIKEHLYIWMRHPTQQSSGGGPRGALFQSVKLEMLYRWRIARYVSRYGSNRLREYMLHFYIPQNFVKQFTVFAERKDWASYERQMKKLRHRTMRNLLLSTVKFFWFEPEVFGKAMLLLCCPKFYYRLRS